MTGPDAAARSAAAPATDHTDPASGAPPVNGTPTSAAPATGAPTGAAPASPGRSTVRLSRPDRRIQLLAAARSVFVTQGYHAAGMDEIADGAGVSKPVLYQHFPSKLELYLALLTESAHDMVERVRAAISGTPDNQERTHRAVSAYFGYVADEAQAYRLIFESDLRGELEVERIVEQATADCIEAITATITADTGVDPERARLLASGLVGLSQVSARWWVAQGGSVPASEAVELLSTLAWRGISRFPRHAPDRGPTG